MQFAIVKSFIILLDDGKAKSVCVWVGVWVCVWVFVCVCVGVGVCVWVGVFVCDRGRD